MDDSDELGCRTIYWGEDGPNAYINELTPRPYNEVDGHKLPVLISADIQNILHLEEIEGLWQPKVVFTLRWFDKRLLFQNLKNRDNLNILVDEEKELIWFPEIVFSNIDNTLSRMLLDEKSSIIVKREGEGFPNDFTDFVAAELFHGYENPFLYSGTYSTKFECEFDLRSYPFDTQECLMELKGPDSQRVNLTAHSVQYSGSKDLPQFEILNVKAFNEDGKAIFVLSFRRKFSYHIISVYIPSLSLFAISLATMLVKIEHFDSTIMVHLTSLLVTYTLFQAISVTLPMVGKVSLLKHFETNFYI